MLQAVACLACQQVTLTGITSLQAAVLPYEGVCL